MRLRMILFAAFGVVLLAAIGIVVALATLDFGRFKGPLAAQVAQATGRALAFEGEVSLRLFPRPSLTVKDATLANAPWGSQPNMLRVGLLTAEVELRPLLFERALHITRVVLRDADLLLETDAEGRRNWDFTRPAVAPSDTGPGVRTDAGGLPLIDEILLGNIAITWRDGRGRDARAGEATRSVLLQELKLTSRPDGRLALAASSIYREQPIAIAGDLDLPTGFLAPGGPFVANLSVTLPGTVIKLAGGLADARAGKGLDLSVSAEAEPLKSLDELLGAILPATKAHLSARIQGDLGATLRAAELVLRVGRSDLAGTAALDLSGPRPKLTADLDSTKLDVLEAWPAGGASEVSRAEASGGRLFSAEPFDFSALHGLDADVTLRVALLQTTPVQTTPAPVERVMLRLVLVDGDLALRPYAFTLAGSHVAGDGRLNTRATPPALVLDVAAQQVDIGRLLALAGAPALLEAKGDVVLALRGQGESPRAIAASLDGTASLVVGQGVLKSGYIDALGLGALRNALPQAQKLADTKLNCAIARFAIARGVATARLLAADAGDISMIGTGTVNLGTEVVALDLAPRLKLAGLGGVVVPVQVRGTLLEPNIAVLGRGGLRANPLAALGAIVLDPGASRANPCGGLAEVPARGATPGLPDVLRLLPR